MLNRFEVTGFKGFKDTLVFDLSARDYAFNQPLVKDGIVNKGIIYGKNGIGKSSLGVALFDIVVHLTDKERLPAQYYLNYLNLESGKDYAEFKYCFNFDGDQVEYEYRKRDPYYLLQETLTVNGKKVLHYDYFNPKKNKIDKSLIGDLKIDLVDNRLSIVKYIARNTPTNMDSCLYKMMQFVNNMLWYRGLIDGNAYCGFANGSISLIEGLYATGKKDEFQKFLAENGVDFNLEWRNNNGIHELLVCFPNKKKVPFLTIASTGTMSLLLFFFWSVAAFGNISFLFVDEFDAFFHYEAAENIVLRLNKGRSFQSFVTTHNTYLMQNKLTRPDCCFIMTDNKITSLANSTEKEIREAHNLEKMYINGAFTE